MSDFLKQNKLGTADLESQRMLTEAISQRWEGVGFLDGLKGQHKHNMAMLFENTAKHMLQESTVSQSSGSFQTVAFPMVRRIFSKLLANDIVSVQAMNLPIGKLFFFVPKTSKRDAEGRQTSTMADQMPLIDATKQGATQWMKKNLYDLFYNNGMFDNSKGNIKNVVVTNATPVSPYVVQKDGEMAKVGTTYEGVVVKQPLGADGTVREAIIQVKGFEEYQGILAFKGENNQYRNDGISLDTDSFLGSLKVVTKNDILDRDDAVIVPAGGEVPFTVFTQQYGKAIVGTNYDVNKVKQGLCNPEGTLYLRLDLMHPVGMDKVETIDGYVGANKDTYADAELTVTFVQYESLEMSTAMGEVTFDLEQVTVSAEERKLRATWSPELATDVNAFHNIDAEAELTALLSEQIASEIDREIIIDLTKGSAWVTRWDRMGWKQSSQASNAYTQKDWNQTLITKINQISAQIQKATLQGGAHYIVVSTEASALLNDLEYFAVSDASAESEQYNMGITRAGSIQGRYTVYVDPYLPANTVLVGHKGRSILDTGYIYAPYVPIQLTGVLQNPFNFANVRGISTRYAKKLVNNKFFGKVVIDNIETFNYLELR